MRLATDDGRVVADPLRRRPGRGAYVCGAACLGTALERRALPRAFRRPVTVEAEKLDLE